MCPMSTEIKKRFRLSKSDSKRLFDELKTIGIELDLYNKTIEHVELKSGEIIYLVDGKPELIKIGNRIIPFLTSKIILRLPRLYVDQGAVPHIVNGADVMAPGITKVTGELKEGQLAIVVNQTSNKPLSVVEIMNNWSQSLEAKHGKVAKNLHHINDKFWKIALVLSRTLSEP